MRAAPRPSKALRAVFRSLTTVCAPAPEHADIAVPVSPRLSPQCRVVNREILLVVSPDTTRTTQHMSMATSVATAAAAGAAGGGGGPAGGGGGPPPGPPPEVPGDVYDRQRVIGGWDQARMEAQVCTCVARGGAAALSMWPQVVLVLGTGGIGSAYAMAVARMGVSRILLVDRDVVDASNLNRQVLFAPRDVGRRKVDAAADALAGHAARSAVEAHHMDMVTHWGDVVALARRATVVCNGCDYGGFFDVAVAALCTALRLPLITGSTYANSFQNEFFTGAPGGPCWACNNGGAVAPAPSTVAAALADGPAGEAGVLGLLRGAAHMTHGDVPGMVREAMEEAGCGGGGVASAASFARVARALSARIADRLVPSRILGYDALDFIPKDAAFPTRTVGSWVVVCVAGSLLSVNLWVQHLMGHGVVNWTNCDLRGVVDVTDGCGDKWPFYRAVVASSPECRVCRDAAAADAAAAAAAAAAGGST